MKLNNHDLGYFLEWRSYLWKPPIRWLVGHPNRFTGKRVLDLGCRSGKMACYFGLLGAIVTGIDLPGVDMDVAKLEAQKWNVQNTVSFRNYDGDPWNIEKDEYDFIFTKSVLIIIPKLEEFLVGLVGSMRIGGELIAAENMQTSPFINKAIAWFTGSKLRQTTRFNGVNRQFLRNIENVFHNVESRTFYYLVAAIRATRTK